MSEFKLKEEIENEEDLLKIKRMIQKECQRNSLTNLCESWGFTCEAFDDFLEMACQDFDLKNN
jgi:hypothetical protein